MVVIDLPKKVAFKYQISSFPKTKKNGFGAMYIQGFLLKRAQSKKNFNSLNRCIFYSLLVEPNWKFSYGAPCTDKKTFFVCWSQILSALLIFAKFPIFALFPLPPCNWLRNCASDKFGHFFWHQMHHLSNTAQLWEKRHYGTKKIVVLCPQCGILRIY